MPRIVINISQKKDDQITFSSEQYHYIFRVLRLRIDDIIIVMDGLGNCWLVRLKPDCGQVLEAIASHTELPFDVTLLVALPKGNGFDEIVRCCTELGVKNIFPLESDRTLLKPSANKLQRWRKIAQEAAEQSERIIVPQILEPLKFKDLFNPKMSSPPLLIDNQLEEYHGYICVARGDNDHLIKCVEKGAKNIIIATGPEGGWTEKEVELAIKNNFKPVSLGNRVLRAITAPITAMSIIGAINN
jgi:16S rRNA (uracil1498-N3)-methyltransferase